MILTPLTSALSDLNSDMLLNIQSEIKKEFGDRAVESYLSLVQQIKILSATAFINAIKELYWNNWVLSERINQSGICIENEGSAFGTLAAAMFPNNRDDTNAIRSKFLQKNGIAVTYEAGDMKFKSQKKLNYFERLLRKH